MLVAVVVLVLVLAGRSRIPPRVRVRQRSVLRLVPGGVVVRIGRLVR
jgi:hypothetical protein